jgi:sugar-specific transcriptional regulator TrmB
MNSHGAIRPLLQRIGLDEKEIEIYLALLPLKMARASAIAKAAKQSRSHTYLILRALEEKGLVSEVERGKVIHFIAEDPKRLLSYVQDREREYKELQPLVKSALPILSSLTGILPGKPRITMLQGEDGIRQLYRDILAQEFRAIFNAQAMYDTFGRNIVVDMFGDDVRLQGRDLFVDNEAGRRFANEVTQTEGYEIRLLPKGISSYSEMIILGDTVSFFAYDEDRTIVRIENKNIADACRSWFDVIWENSKKIAG